MCTFYQLTFYSACPGSVMHHGRLSAVSCHVCCVIVDSILRPVLLIAPFASSLIAKLTSESPDKFCGLDFGMQYFICCISVFLHAHERQRCITWCSVCLRLSNCLFVSLSCVAYSSKCQFCISRKFLMSFLFCCRIVQTKWQCSQVGSFSLWHHNRCWSSSRSHGQGQYFQFLLVNF